MYESSQSPLFIFCRDGFVHEDDFLVYLKVRDIIRDNRLFLGHSVAVFQVTQDRIKSDDVMANDVKNTDCFVVVIVFACRCVPK